MRVLCFNKKICWVYAKIPVGQHDWLAIHWDKITSTGFTGKQVQRLYSRFKQLDKRDCGFLTREDLFCIPEVNINPLGERLIDVIVEDHGENNKINFKQFITMLARFRQGKSKSTTDFNSRESKLQFLFDVRSITDDFVEEKCVFLDVRSKSWQENRSNWTARRFENDGRSEYTRWSNSDDCWSYNWRIG